MDTLAPSLCVACTKLAVRCASQRASQGEHILAGLLHPLPTAQAQAGLPLAR